MQDIAKIKMDLDKTRQDDMPIIESNAMLMLLHESWVGPIGLGRTDDCTV